MGKNRRKPPTSGYDFELTEASANPPASGGEEIPTTTMAGAQRWQTTGDKYFSANLSLERIPAGLYSCGIGNNTGPYIAPVKIETDTLIELPDSPSADVIQEIQQFWELEPEFTKHGFIHKRGVLLWGPPGSGKTVTLQQIVKNVIVQHQGIALHLGDPHLATLCLQMIRRIEATRPIVALLEDLESLVEEHDENQYLALLDGESQIANVVYIATTNYPEKLDYRFTDRPSRFDLVKSIGMPSAALRRAYLLQKVPDLQKNDAIEEWVRKSNDFSIAHLRELLVLCFCYHKTLDQAIDRLQKMRERTAVSTRDENSKFGFTV
jgi:hypothetical protein